MPNGVIDNVCEAHCIQCEDAYLGLSWPKREAEKELRREGWKKIAGKWTCWRCVAPTP